jgi:predicted dehydrogenase
MMTAPKARVALIGATGHGGWHLRAIASPELAELVTLVALGDVNEVPDAPPGVPLFRHHDELLAATKPDVVIVCTPPHTHRPIATAALRAGADVLLEKPPVLDLAEHDELTGVLAETGRVVQVGFQALGSVALTRLRDAIAAGTLGTVTGIAARGAWIRPDAYFRRAAWVGRRTLDGRPVLDGALVNPFAHAVMQVLALLTEPVSTVDVALYRAHDIEVDDTACLRLRTASGPTALIAVTLCGEAFVPGNITVTGTGGTAELEYPTDRLRLPGEAELTAVPGRISLLANVIAHRADPATALLAPLAATREFTALLAPILAATPAEVPPGHRRNQPDHVEIVGVNGAIDAAAERLALFSELPDAEWARPQETP